jgi:hypothetical protein
LPLFLPPFLLSAFESKYEAAITEHAESKVSFLSMKNERDEAKSGLSLSLSLSLHSFNSLSPYPSFFLPSSLPPFLLSSDVLSLTREMKALAVESEKERGMLVAEKVT